MTTITMQIDESVFSLAQRKAAAMDTSVNEVLSTFLQQWASEDSIQDAKAAMARKFAQPDWQFTVGNPDDREQRNARR